MSLANWIDITDKSPMRFDTNRMLQEIKVLEEGQWLDHYDKGLSKGWKAIPLVSMEGGIKDSEAQRAGTFDQFKPTPLLDRLPYFQEILRAFPCRYGRIRIMKLLPGCNIGEHRDVGLEVINLAFNRVRLHVPIQTNDRVIFGVDGEHIKMHTGGLYYVNFSKKHFVRNDGETARIHLVMDLEVNDWLAQLFPPMTPIDHMAAFVQRMTLPVFWKLRSWKNRTVDRLWKKYEGSRLQRLRHGLLTRNVT